MKYDEHHYKHKQKYFKQISTHIVLFYVTKYMLQVYKDYIYILHAGHENGLVVHEFTLFILRELRYISMYSDLFMTYQIYIYGILQDKGMQVMSLNCCLYLFYPSYTLNK